MTVTDAYIPAGLVLGLLIALAALSWLPLRRLLLASAGSAVLVALIPFAARRSDHSIGLTLFFGAIICAGFAVSAMLGWRSWRRSPVRYLGWFGLAALYCLIGIVLPDLQGRARIRDELGFDLGLQVLGLPMLAGLAVGAVIAALGTRQAS